MSNKNSPQNTQQTHTFKFLSKQLFNVNKNTLQQQNAINMEENSKEILQKSQEIIKIQPKTKYLSANELISLRNVEIPNISAGLKRTKMENSLEEQKELENLYDNLQKQLSRPRIERLAGRAVGVWDAEKNLVRVERKDGKFGNFGFSIEGQLYLEYYEALFLMEVNRLQLEYNSTIMSIEQAYTLLMGEQHSSKYQEYLVYSNLTRIGYIVVKHQNKHFQKHQINSESDCVWAILEAELQNELVADYIKKTPFYGKVKEKFDLIKNTIKNQTKNINKTIQEREKEINLSNEINFQEKIKPNLKRKAAEETQNEWFLAKRHCNYNLNITNHSLVDFLKDEDEYKQFKEIFQKFDIVPLKSNERKRRKENKEVEEELSESESDTEMDDIEINNLNIKYHINFDVYLHNEGFRKSSPHLPNFRVIVLQNEQRFPTHDEIYHTHRQQLNPVPLLIVSINDSKQMQAFLYYFS